MESSPSGIWKENKQPAQCTGNSKERSRVMAVATLKGSSTWPAEMNAAEAQGEYGVLGILEELERAVLVMTVKAICKE